MNNFTQLKYLTFHYSTYIQEITHFEFIHLDKTLFLKLKYLKYIQTTHKYYVKIHYTRLKYYKKIINFLYILKLVYFKVKLFLSQEKAKFINKKIIINNLNILLWTKKIFALKGCYDYGLRKYLL